MGPGSRAPRPSFIVCLGSLRVHQRPAVGSPDAREGLATRMWGRAGVGGAPWHAGGMGVWMSHHKLRTIKVGWVKALLGGLIWHFGPAQFDGPRVRKTEAGRPAWAHWPSLDGGRGEVVRTCGGDGSDPNSSRYSKGSRCRATGHGSCIRRGGPAGPVAHRGRAPHPLHIHLTTNRT